MSDNYINENYVKKYGVSLISCLNCECFETVLEGYLMTGNYDSELEAIKGSEQHHKEVYTKCKNPKLQIEIIPYYKSKNI